MPPFAGLWDGVHGEAYSAMPKSPAIPPHSHGLLRVLFQDRGMHGLVETLGQDSPATIAQVDAARNSMAVYGTFTYSTRTNNKDETITNIEAHAVTPAISESVARPATLTAAAVEDVIDTRLNNEYAKDDADSGITAPALPEVTA